MFSGLSSVVRKCVHKASGQEYAVKIVDKLGDHGGCDIGEITKTEADILKTLSGHKNISKQHVCMHVKISGENSVQEVKGKGFGNFCKALTFLEFTTKLFKFYFNNYNIFSI